MTPLRPNSIVHIGQRIVNIRTQVNASVQSHWQDEGFGHRRIAIGGRDEHGNIAWTIYIGDTDFSCEGWYLGKTPQD